MVDLHCINELLKWRTAPDNWDRVFRDYFLESLQELKECFVCGCAYWEFVFMFFGYSAEKLGFPAVESFNQSVTLGDQACLEFNSILLEHKERTESDHITSALYESISVSVCVCCTCMCCTIFLSCTRNSLASVAWSDRTFSAWESWPWKYKDRR